MKTIEGLKKKIYIATVGMPDCGKSTFIKNIVQYITNRTVNVDSFCDEQQLDMTIRSAQLFMRDSSLQYDIVFLDCPGHIFEYEDEAKSVLSKSHIMLKIINDMQHNVVPYNDNYKNETVWENQLNKILGNRVLPTIELHSHSLKNDILCYDADGIKTDKFDGIMNYIKQFISNNNFELVDPVDTAIRIIRYACEYAENPVAMCSFGKDSIAMLKLFELAGVLDKIKIEYPNSGYDLPGINAQFINDVKNYFNISEIEPFDVIEPGWTFDNHSVQDMMLCKARMLTNRINKNKYDMCFTGIRRDEEGTRAKEKFFSPRNINGNFDYLEPQCEIYGNEIDIELLKKYPQCRVNPLLDMCEADVWWFTKHYKLPYCSEYISKNGKRYRSLGDWPITTPINSNAKTIDEICQEVDVSLIPERACRAKQDKSIKFGMEKLRKAGFF